MKVIVSNPIKHHTHQFIIGLLKKGYFKRYFTSVWYNDKSRLAQVINQLPSAIGTRLRAEISKRTNKEIDSKLVMTFPIGEVMRKLISQKSEFWVFMSEQLHDIYFSRVLKKMDFDIFVGSEKSSLRCFRAAKRKNKITVLDLAQVHFKKIEELRQKFSVLNDNLVSGRVLKLINKIKQQELREVDYIITLSDFARESLLTQNLDANKIKLVNLGFDPEKFSLKDFKNRTTSRFTLLFVGPITKRKGIQLICQAIENLDNPDIELLLIGSILDSEDLIRHHHSFVKHIPFLPHDQLVKYYQSADVFVFPSYLDSWGMVVLEAMACGTPVIVSENTGSQEVVRKGGGFVIETGDESALRAQIQSLYENRADLKSLGLKAHQVVQEYTWAKYHEKLTSTLEGIYRQKFNSN